MARQHFYSRVPARVSLYNKTDSFDTFAKGVAVQNDLVMGELSVMYKDKLDIHNSLKLRRGEIPTVYSQAKLSDGDIVQTTIKYLPTDFTGERSAYLAHSLILNREERGAVFYSNTAASFTPNMFVTDVEGFRLTDPTSAPNPMLEDKQYIPAPLTTSLSSISEYDPEMMKKLIFAVVASLCDSGRDICFRLPVEDIKASDEALRLINIIMSVLPYEMRERLSFATYVSTTDAYRGFKLRCVSSDCKIGPGFAYFDFTEGKAYGQIVGYEHNLSVAAFLYSLIDNRKVRDEFHVVLSAISARYNIKINSIKALSEIVFLYWQCSGFYLESSILPTDETLISFLDIYEKYREGLTEEQRVRAYRPLARYSDNHVAIPTAIFDRMTRLYADECVAAKAVALDVALSLIHVDVMRDRLFTFITRNYDREIDSVKAVVNENLARVFYGGFLQHKILAFFDMRYSREPVATKDYILDKLLLSIRTKDIQRQIVVFLDRHYDRMNHEERMKIYATCFEMIPECDDLSAMLVGLINRRILREGAEVRKYIGDTLISILDRSIRHGDSRVIAVFVNDSGFCEELTTKYILEKQVGGDLFEKLMAGMPAHKRAEKLLNIRGSSREISDEEYLRLVGRFKDMELNLASSTLYEIIAADSRAEGVLKGQMLDQFRKIIIYPAVTAKLYDVFTVRLGKDGIMQAMKYAEGKSEVLTSRQYGTITDYNELVDCALKGDTTGAFRVVDRLPTDKDVRSDIAEHLLMCKLDRANQSEKTVCIFELIINYLRSGFFRFDTLYPRYRKHFEDQRAEETNFIKEKIDPAKMRGAADAVELLLGCIKDICDVSPVFAANVCHTTSGLKRVLKDFFNVWGAGARIHLKKHFKDGYEGVVDIMDELVESRNATITSFDDLKDLLLKRFEGIFE